jgi:hypothetical protein
VKAGQEQIRLELDTKDHSARREWGDDLYGLSTKLAERLNVARDKPAQTPNTGGKWKPYLQAALENLVRKHGENIKAALKSVPVCRRVEFPDPPFDKDDLAVLLCPWRKPHPRFQRFLIKAEDEKGDVPIDTVSNGKPKAGHESFVAVKVINVNQRPLKERTEPFKGKLKGETVTVTWDGRYSATAPQPQP